MPNFNDKKDEDTSKFLIKHFYEFGAGEAEPNLAKKLIDQITSGILKIERRNYGFAIIKPESQKLSGFMARKIPLESDLMFIYVSPEESGKGIGSRFLAELKVTYMKDQPMKLVCAGDERRDFFETGGFHKIGENPNGHNVMSCEAQ